MLAIKPDPFTNFCCEGTMGAAIVVAAIYFLLRAFRKNDGQGGRPPDVEG
jgi:hypothetical protein